MIRAASLFLFWLLAASPTWAGSWSLDLKGGLTMPIRTTPDGTFWQQGYPHDTRLVTGAYGVGLDYTITPAVSVQGHLLDLGSSRLSGQATSDENYDLATHTCVKKCDFTYRYRATDSLRGGDLTVSYTWGRDGLRPFVKGGAALLYHRARFRNEFGDEDRFHGWVPEVEVGAGLSYHWVYVEVDYFHGLNFGGRNLPISDRQLVGFVGVRIPASF